MKGEAEGRLYLADLYSDLEHPSEFLLDDDWDDDLRPIPRSGGGAESCRNKRSRQ
jgi:hypothetical protein